MGIKRPPFQGVKQILMFNWQLYVFAFGAILICFFTFSQLPNPLSTLAGLIGIGIMLNLLTSTLVSYYVYDLSDLYQLKILPDISSLSSPNILNIHAGFDEISGQLRQRFPGANLQICDFYNPEQHTEVSIRRARKLYPPAPETLSVSTKLLPFPDKTFELILVFLAAHEIRDTAERAAFFQELARLIQSGGKIVVTEHLRDLPNFLAYSVGFMHFHSHKTWLRTFGEAGLVLRQEIKITPFISTFILEAHDNPA